MALNKEAFNHYKENSIGNSKPEELTLMLYNGIIRFLFQAETAIDENDFEKANAVILKAEDILLEFQYTLDMQYEISKPMILLYDYMYWRLIDANAKKDREILEEVLFFATELRDTWQAAMKLIKEQAAPAPSAELDEALMLTKSTSLHAVPVTEQPESVKQAPKISPAQAAPITVTEPLAQAIPAEELESELKEMQVPKVRQASQTPAANRLMSSQMAAYAKNAKADKNKDASIQERL